MSALKTTVDQPRSWKLGLPGRAPALLAISVALIAFAAIALGFNIVRLRESFTWVEHTNEVLRNIASAERALLEAESEERGFLLTAEGSYLDSYNHAQGEILSRLQALRQLTLDNASQTQRIDELSAKIQARLDEFTRVIELGPTRLKDALAILGAARSRQLTPQIEEGLSQLRQAELSLLDDRQRTADRAARLVTLLAAATGALALLSAGIGAFLLQRQRSMVELARSRSELMTREAYLQAILTTVPDAMIVIDERGVIQSFSATAEGLFGFSSQEVLGRNVNMLMPAPYRQEHDGYLSRYLATGDQRIIGIGRIVAGQRKDGTTMPIELAVGEISLQGHRHFVGFLRDLTQRQERERHLHEVQSELLHVSRVSSLGEMASALAHELNQPLTAVTNYLRGSKRVVEGISGEQTGLLREALDKAADQALRAGQVVQRLRQFMAYGETEKRIESIRKIAEEAAALALIVAKEQSVRVSYELDPVADSVLVDKIQIQQVLLNLLRNAIEAMQSCERRELAISTMPGSDGMIAVAVADTGPGIAPDVVSRLFQPFVTTKAKGMGVGLSISRTIVESHGGRITCEARPNGGTVFRFTLPAADLSAIEDFEQGGDGRRPQ
jgi:two-component system, LuxR family, sensor kinase FixL